eukprot:TRINITY_DN6305_c0_g3_i1.p1 TRINITY_DN6305_c0_g3~~TRINITY_DN6305_c0_g3_i1.p1  ORF type:complete len:575 (+),score=174.56 TRINITY_DN6305_c0_g3_i1:105-1829(+)
MAGRTLVGAACPKCSRAQQAPAEAVVNCTFCGSPFRAPSAAAAAALQAQVNAKAQAAAAPAPVPTRPPDAAAAAAGSRSLGNDPPVMPFTPAERNVLEAQTRMPHRAWLPPTLKKVVAHWAKMRTDELPLRTGYLPIRIPDDPIPANSKHAPEKEGKPKETKEGDDESSSSDSSSDSSDSEDEKVKKEKQEKQNGVPTNSKAEVVSAYVVLCCGLVPQNKIDPISLATVLHRLPLIAWKTKGTCGLYGGRIELSEGVDPASPEADDEIKTFLLGVMKKNAGLTMPQCRWDRFLELCYAPSVLDDKSVPRRSIFMMPRPWEMPAGIKMKCRKGLEPVRCSVADLQAFSFGAKHGTAFQELCMVADALAECITRDACEGIKDCCFKRKGKDLPLEFTAKRARMDLCDDWCHAGTLRNNDSLQDCFGILESPPLGVRVTEANARAPPRGLLRKERIAAAVLAADPNVSLWEAQQCLSGLPDIVQYIPSLVKNAIGLKAAAAGAALASDNLPAAVAARGAVATQGMGSSQAISATHGLIGIGGTTNPLQRAATVSALAATAKITAPKPVSVDTVKLSR